jgi:nucleoid DNA-binding protein
MKIPTSISKRVLLSFVNNKLNHIIKYYHVYGVLTILFDEILKDLISGKKIKIFNFGTIFLQKNKSRKYFDVRFQKIMQSGENKMLKFILSPVLRKKICDSLDIDRTFKGD